MTSGEPTHARTAANPFGLQAEASHYSGTSYLSPERLSSIGYQFKLACESGGKSFVNVGASHGLLELLLARSSLHVIGIDLDPALQPDIIGVLPFLPLRDSCVDVAMAFQVLEHMPFGMLGDCLRELRRVARARVIVSLPDRTPFFPFHPTTSRLEALALSFYRWTWTRQRWRYAESTYVDPQHFWEIGNPGITAKTIVEQGAAVGLNILELCRNPYFPYHTFFLFARMS